MAFWSLLVRRALGGPRFAIRRSQSASCKRLVFAPTRHALIARIAIRARRARTDAPTSSMPMLRPSGPMKAKSDAASWMPCTANQTISTQRCEFDWLARRGAGRARLGNRQPETWCIGKAASRNGMMPRCHAAPNAQGRLALPFARSRKCILIKQFHTFIANPAGHSAFLSRHPRQEKRIESLNQNIFLRTSGFQSIPSCFKANRIGDDFL